MIASEHGLFRLLFSTIPSDDLTDIIFVHYDIVGTVVINSNKKMSCQNFVNDDTSDLMHATLTMFTEA